MFKTCKDCGSAFEGGPKTLYCEKCRRRRNNESWAKSHAKRKTKEANDMENEALACAILGIEADSHSAISEDVKKSTPERKEYEEPRTEVIADPDEYLAREIPEERVRVGGVYRHWKGGRYKVMALATHTETGEEMVVYKPVETAEVYVRPLGSWLEPVQCVRFAEVEDEEI